MGPAVSSLHFQRTMKYNNPMHENWHCFEFISCYILYTINLLCIIRIYIALSVFEVMNWHCTRKPAPPLAFRWFWTTEAIGAGSVVQGCNFSVSYVCITAFHIIYIHKCYNRIAKKVLWHGTLNRDYVETGYSQEIATGICKGASEIIIDADHGVNMLYV